MRRKLFAPSIGSSRSSRPAAILTGQGRLAESEAMTRRRWQCGKAVGQPKPGSGRVAHTWARAFVGGSCEAEVCSGRRCDANETVGDEHPTVATFLGNLGACSATGEFAEPETVHRRALAIQRKLLSSEHPNIATSLNNLGEVAYKHASWRRRR